MNENGLTARPFWSVMVPTYNPREEYLAATLQSVLQQDPGKKEMQIEVVDDGSPDNAFLEMVRKLGGDRVTISSEPKNLGLAGIWNKCIERARGEWIHILHQDDLVYPGFYEALRVGVEENPDVGAAFCRHAYTDQDGHWRELSILERSSAGVINNFVEALVTGYHIQCAAIVVRRSTYDSLGGFSPELKHALDWEMWIRIANAFSFFYEPRILAAWRNHPDATTSGQRRTGENIRDIVKAISIWRKYLPAVKGDALAEIALTRFANEAFEEARYFSRLDDFDACRKQVAAALQSDHSFASCNRAVRILAKAGAKKLFRLNSQ